MALLLSEGQMSDHKGAYLLLPGLPAARELLVDRGYDSDRLPADLAGRGTEPCIPPVKGRKVRLPYDKVLYRRRHRIENAFGRLKDWRRVATRYGPVRPHLPLSHLHRSHGHLLAAVVSPEPGGCDAPYPFMPGQARRADNATGSYHLM